MKTHRTICKTERKDNEIIPVHLSTKCESEIKGNEINFTFPISEKENDYISINKKEGDIYFKDEQSADKIYASLNIKINEDAIGRSTSTVTVNDAELADIKEEVDDFLNKNLHSRKARTRKVI